VSATTPCLHSVQGAFDGKPSFIEHVGIDHGGRDIPMSEQFLHRSDIITRFQQMRCETVAEGVAANRFRDGWRQKRFAQGF
jgi:hypothetical protein